MKTSECRGRPCASPLPRQGQLSRQYEGCTLALSGHRAGTRPAPTLGVFRPCVSFILTQSRRVRRVFRRVETYQKGVCRGDRTVAYSTNSIFPRSILSARLCVSASLREDFYMRQLNQSHYSRNYLFCLRRTRMTTNDRE